MTKPSDVVTSQQTTCLWRSMLYVPAHVDRFIEKAQLLDVDAVQLDLEDSVPASEKDRARARISAAAARVRRGGADVIVRINGPIGMAVRDIEASVGSDVCALNLPKVAGADHVRLLSEHIALIEAQRNLAVGSTKLIVMIETPAALLRALEICCADPRIVGAILGAEDFAVVTGAKPDSELLESAKKSLILAATAAGIAPFGTLGSIAHFRDVEAYRQIVRRSRDCGFRGSTCIHPDQVAVLNAEFMPSARELEWAAAVVAKFGEGDGGAVAMDGEMIDLPVLSRAQSIRALKVQIERRNALRRSVVNASSIENNCSLPNGLT
jgi:citrate lyase subunit beta / citryl-CoA lyase